MTRVHCMSCGKHYDYEANGCCPNCGAYNRPPRRHSIGADGMVHHLREESAEERGAVATLIGHEVSELLHRDTAEKPEHYGEKECYEKKVCYEEKSCFEEQAQRVRNRGVHTLNLSERRSQRQRGREARKPGSKKGLIILVIALALTAIFNMVANRADVFFGDDDWSVEWTDDDIDAAFADLNEFFTLDGEDVRVMDWQIFGDEVTFVIQGREDLGVELGYWDEDGEYDDITDFDVESLGSGAPLLDEILAGHAARYTCSIDDARQLDNLMLYGDNEGVEVNTAMQRMSVQRHFGYQGIEISVDDLNMEREGPSKVLDDLYLDVGILSTDNDLQLEEMPQLWTRTAGGILNAVEVERADYDYARCDLRYNLGRGEGIEEMTLYFPDCGDGAYWVELQ